MTEYGYMINGQLIKQKEPTQQSKPLVYTEEPTVDDHHMTIFSWVEGADAITQVWDVVEVEPAEPPEEITDTEALNILLGGEA